MIAQFIHDVIVGTAATLFFMIFGLLASLVMFREMDEGPIHFVFCICIPLVIAGMLISKRGIRFPRTVSVVSSFIALLIPPIAVASYWDWNLTQIGSDYLYAFLGIPFSALGASFVGRRVVQ